MLLVLGMLLVGRWATASLESRNFQRRASERFDAALRRGAATAPAPATRIAAYSAPAGECPPGNDAGGVLGRIEIPHLHLTTMIAEGTDARTLAHAVGHIPATALPGNAGNCGLAGHRDTFLRGLGGLRLHDMIGIVTAAGRSTYEVEWCRVVEPSRVDVLDSTATRSLTLVTCYPFGYVGHAPQRFVVRARMVAFAAGSDGGRLRPEALAARR